MTIEALREAINKKLDFFTEPGGGEVYLKDLENDLLSEFLMFHTAEIERIIGEKCNSGALGWRADRDEGFNQHIDDARKRAGLDKT